MENKISYFFKVALDLWKEALLLFIYMIIMGFLSMFVTQIGSLGTRVILYIIVIAFFCFLSILLTKSTGERQYKNMITANLRRSKCIDEDIKKYCKPQTEYRAYKGALIGITIFLPLYILLIIRIFVNTVGLNAIIRLIFMIFAMPLAEFGTDTSVFYIGLLSLLEVVCCAFGYFLGAKKIMLQQDKLQKTHEEIYGKGK